MILEYKFSFVLFVSYCYSIPVSTAKMDSSTQYTAPQDCWAEICWNIALNSFTAVILVKKKIRKVATIGERSNIIFINKADSKVSLKVNVTQCYDKIRSRFWFSISIDVTKNVIIDFNRLNWLINRQISSTIEYYRLIDYIFSDRFLSIRYALI